MLFQPQQLPAGHDSVWVRASARFRRHKTLLLRVVVGVALAVPSAGAIALAVSASVTGSIPVIGARAGDRHVLEPSLEARQTKNEARPHQHPLVSPLPAGGEASSSASHEAIRLTPEPGMSRNLQTNGRSDRPADSSIDKQPGAGLQVRHARRSKVRPPRAGKLTEADF